MSLKKAAIMLGSKTIHSLTAALVLMVCPGGPSLGAGSLKAVARMGPLVHPERSPYFVNSFTGRAVYLAGEHTWNNLQNYPSEIAMDYTGYLDFMEENGHNFMRMWTTMGTGGLVPVKQPTIYERTGPGSGNDGEPKYDLERLNPEFFENLKSRVIQARDRGIYVSVMFFAGDNVIDQPGNPNWPYHPYQRDNNINGIDGDPDHDGEGIEAHSLVVPAITAFQETYVRKVFETVDGLDNVLYEISNEDHGSAEWQYHMVNFAKGLSSHPVGMTTFADYDPGDSALFNGPADWVSPSLNITTADGHKVIIMDTDHLGPIISVGFVWQCFTRGLHVIDMDQNFTGALSRNDFSSTDYDRAMGHAVSYGHRMNLSAMRPQDGLSSTSYCLAKPGSEYLVFQPEGGRFSVDLSSGTYTVEWFNPATGNTSSGRRVEGGGWRNFDPPFGGEAVLYLKIRRGVIR